MCAFAHMYLLLDYSTINSLAVGYIVRTTFQESAVGEENVSWSSETKKSFIVRNSIKNFGDSDYACRYGVWDRTKTCLADRDRQAGIIH